MLKSKLGLVAGVLAATLSMQSMASEVATAQAPLSVDELSFAFADVGSADVLAMSQGEMKETEGAVAPLALLAPFLMGAGIGGGMYAGPSAISSLDQTYVRRNNQSFGQNWNNNFNTNQLLFSTAVGSVTGGTAGTILRGHGVTLPHNTFMFGNGTYSSITNQALRTPMPVQRTIQNSPAFVRNIAQNQIRTWTNPAAVTISGTSMGSSHLANRQFDQWNRPQPPNVQINHNTHQMNQQMLNQNLYGDFQRFANTQQNFQMPPPRFCPSYTGTGMGMNICS